MRFPGGSLRSPQGGRGRGREGEAGQGSRAASFPKKTPGMTTQSRCTRRPYTDPREKKMSQTREKKLQIGKQKFDDFDFDFDFDFDCFLLSLSLPWLPPPPSAFTLSPTLLRNLLRVLPLFSNLFHPPHPTVAHPSPPPTPNRKKTNGSNKRRGKTMQHVAGDMPGLLVCSP